MIILILFSFLAGVVTVLSPCILPVLPIILSSSLSGGHRRPLGVITGFIFSFTFFTLFLSILVSALGISADKLRLLSVVTIFLFGISLLIPASQVFFEALFSRLSRYLPQQTGREGFFGGLLVGISIGLLWTPCVGPILAAVISLALTGVVNGTAFFITLAYSVGTAIPMFIIVSTGRKIFTQVPWLLSKSALIQKTFGVVMIVTALLIFFNIDRTFQNYILDKFPNYGVGLTKLEDNKAVKKALDKINGQKPSVDMGRPTYEMLENQGKAKELRPGGVWFNLPAGKDSYNLQELRGKVVLIDFWTYTCINCIRTLPYLKTWHEKYSSEGLVIIGVHSPEFEFEKSAKNVKKAISDFGLEYPVVQDNDFATWRAYDNHYWPAKYLIDKNGNIRYHHFGEGAYDATERAIQSLLFESGADISDVDISNPSYTTQARTPELYLGYDRAEFLASSERVIPDKSSNYSKPAFFPENSFAFEGEFMVGRQYVSPSLGTKLYLNFEAREVFLVMRLKNSGQARVRVLLDGKVVSAGTAGEDVKEGAVTVTSDRLYRLIRLPEVGRHELMLEFIDDKVELFAFTFG